MIDGRRFGQVEDFVLGKKGALLEAGAGFGWFSLKPLRGTFLALTPVLDFISSCGIQKIILGEVKVKEIIAWFIMMTVLPAAFIAGCGDNKAPTSPPPPTGSTATPTKTSSRTPTMTWTHTVTRTVTATRTVTKTPTVTPTGTQAATLTPTSLPVQAMVNLGTAANYAVLAYSEVTNSGASTLCGSLGLYPLTQVDGGIQINCGGASNVANGAANIAKQNLGTAYTDAAGRTGGMLLSGGADLGGLTLYPGLYTGDGDISISSADLTLDAKGNSNAVFIFQVNGVLNVTSGRQVFLNNGAQSKNVFWQVTDYCSLGTTVHFVGAIMAYNSVTMNTLATLDGHAFGSNGNVTLLANTIIDPTP